MLSNRQEKILQLLQQHTEGLTGEELSTYLGVSSRTVRTDIRNAADDLEQYGIKIHSGTRSGYLLEIINEKLFRNFAQENASPHLESTEDRIHYIIQRFLQCALKDTSLTQQELADELYISLSTLKINLKEAVKQLTPYEVGIVPYKTEGMRLEGKEEKLRYFISEWLADEKERQTSKKDTFLQQVFKNLDLKILETIILQVVKAYELHLTDTAIQNLLLHIAIAMKRAGQENFMNYTVSQTKLMEKTKEFEVASSLFEEIYRQTNIDVATSEVYYLTQHLMTSKKFLEADSSAIQHSTDLVQKIIQAVKENINLDFSQDDTLIRWLALHLKTAIPRMKFQMNIRNEVLDVIKAEYPLAFQVAVLASNILEQQEQIKVNENEIGYIAVHFGAALNRMDIKNDACVKKALLVCGSGMGTAVLLKTRLEEYFQKRIIITDTIPGYQLNESLLQEVDLVVTTVPIHQLVSEKIVWTKHLLNDEEMQALEQKFFSTHRGITADIETFFRRDCFNSHQHFTTRQQVLEFLTEQLKSKGLLDDLAKQSVFEREEASPTEIGGLIAIPHPIYNDALLSSVAVALLDKPILWDKQPVQIVFLLSIAKSQFKQWEPIFLKLFNYLTKNNGGKEILHGASYDAFVRNFKRQF